jgi:hypothetical protein
MAGTETDRIWKELVEELSANPSGDHQETSSGGLQEISDRPLSIFTVGTEAYLLRGDTARKYFRVRDLLGQERELADVASEKRVAKALQGAVAQVMQDTRNGAPRRPGSYLASARKELIQSVIEWRVAAPVAGLVLQGVPSLSLGPVKLVPTRSAGARAMVRDMGRIVKTAKAEQDKKELFLDILSHPLVAEEAPTCAIAKVRSADDTQALTSGLLAIRRAAASLMVYRCAVERPSLRGPIGVPPEVPLTLARASAVSARNVSASHTTRLGAQHPFVVNAAVRREFDRLYWPRLHRICSAGNAATTWERVISSASYWLGSGLMELERDPATAFARFVTVLEMLLCGGDSSERIGGTMAERFAFVTRKRSQHRMAVADRMRKLYDVRSRILHEGVTDVKEEDLQDVGLFALQCFFAVLSMLRKVDSFAALVARCNRLKFG